MEFAKVSRKKHFYSRRMAVPGKRNFDQPSYIYIYIKYNIQINSILIPIDFPMARPGLRSPFQGYELGSDPGRIPDGAGRHPLRQGAAVDRTRGGAADLAAEGARQVTKAL